MQTTEWNPFTAEELMHTPATWANNKSTGPDGISHEAAKELLGDEIWKHRLLYTLNDFFYFAKIPEGVEKESTVLLPKIPVPLEWGIRALSQFDSSQLNGLHNFCCFVGGSSFERIHNYNGPGMDAKGLNSLPRSAASPKWRGIGGWTHGW